MRYLPLSLLLTLLFSACGTETTDVSQPEYINFAAVSQNADAPATNRKTEAYLAKVDLRTVGAAELVVLAESIEAPGQSNAYVLTLNETQNPIAETLDRAWVVYLQDHLLLLEAGGDRKYKLSIQNRPLDSEIVNESFQPSLEIKGAGLARYGEQDVVAGELADVASYLEARAN